MPGVYISYPFCSQKCTFCNFASGVHSRPAQAQYDEKLIREVEEHQWKWLPETLYFGGGTPSLMSRATLGTVTAAILRARGNSPLPEATLECAPGTISPEAVEVWRSCGINRVSLGAQSFVEAELRKTGRRHTAEIVARDVAMLREGGIENINIDLIAGLPLQTPSSWEDSLSWIERFNPPHVSLYIFEIDEDSRLGKEILSGGLRYGADLVPDDDTTAVLYETAVARLRDLGVERYEISNFARSGWESRHNLKYWRLEPYVGFGLDAHSFDGKHRWSNPDTLESYLANDGIARDVTAADPLEERFFIGLRMTHGIEATTDEIAQFAEPIEKWLEAGLMHREGNRLWLSDRGLLVSNEILQEFVRV